jgi:tetratricopeptide (TPR) repeat protein
MSPKSLVVAWVALLAAVSASGQSLRDLAARIDYGFYGGDVTVVRAAIRELESRSSDDRKAAYLYALAHFRLAEIGRGGSRESEALSTCVDVASEIADASSSDAESRVLIAVCSLRLAQSESVRSLRHQRRAQKALEAARAVAPDNPRVAYVTALAANAGVSAEIGVRRLEAAASRFSTYTADGPAWGEVETRLLLAESYLGNGDRRRARDAVEQALLLAPGYGPALELQHRLVGPGR